MSGALQFARANGWGPLLPHALRSAGRRWRDQATARRLRAPGFHAGAAPRLFGLSAMEIGEDFHARDRVWLEAVLHYRGRHYEPRLRIGRSARLSDDVHIACLAEVTIGMHLLCGSRVLITDHAHGAYRGPGASDPAVPPAQRPLHAAAPVWIGNNVWLGDGVAVLAGARIGDGCVIGANAVVTGEIPPETIAVGAPARSIRRWNAAAREWLAIAPGA